MNPQLRDPLAHRRYISLNSPPEAFDANLDAGPSESVPQAAKPSGKLFGLADFYHLIVRRVRAPQVQLFAMSIETRRANDETVPSLGGACNQFSLRVHSLELPNSSIPCRILAREPARPSGSHAMPDLPNIENRLEKLEAELAELKRQNDAKKNDWLSVVAGSFEDDPEFAEIARLGREIRQADRPQDRE